MAVLEKHDYIYKACDLLAQSVTKRSLAADHMNKLK